MKRKTYQTLQAGRGLAALAVVAAHCGVYAGRDPRFWMQASYLHALASGVLGVQFFFVLSGIVILLAHWGDQGRPATIGSYFWKRLRRIYPIYWFVLLLVTPVYLRTYHPLTKGDSLSLVLVSSVLLIHLKTLDTVLLVAWTLYHEVNFYLVFAFSLINRWVGWIALIGWMMGTFMSQAWGPLHPMLAEYLSPLNFLFGIGMLSALFLKKVRSFNWQVPLGAGCLMMIYPLLYSSFHIGELPTPISLLAGFAVAFIVLALIELERRDKLSVPRWLNDLGDASYSIYLVHFPILSLLFRTAFKLDPHAHLSLALWIVLNGSLAVIAGIALHVGVERRLLQWLPAKLSLSPL